MQRPVSSLSLNPGVKVKLVSAGFQFTTDLLHVKPQQLSKEAALNQQEALEVLQAVRRADEGAASSSSTALELLQKEEEELRSIVTFSSQLDAALGGGAPVGRVTEVCGVPGVGKTQLCLQLAVDAQVPRCFGGVGGQVVYIDTEGSFLVQRVADLAAAAVNHCSLLVEDQEQRVAMETFTVESILSNMFVVRCHDYIELLAELHLMPGFLSDHPRVRLLVIDSVASPFRPLFDELLQRTRLLSGFAQQLLSMATSHDIAVVITNQMTTRVQGAQSQLVPALGDSWGHAATIRLLLQWEGPQRLAIIVKSPCHRVSTVRYAITSEGFRDAEQWSEPLSQSETGKQGV
ncbi:DNA repair protein RAD51 homolog 3 [Takifugu flavidus]|uniref:DNA repair protein RAD51 homolog 3 n=1 Tax=Takifugu flavidus TaxID=433684 RepID=A0A5C6MRH3_9TELE|nr:DNA repair protein RAD51 homolog 3 [Takifugu flavidus]TWW56050.1 DNA repair protein RAD51 -like protein 3 [Takifugu flavidus]